MKGGGIVSNEYAIFYDGELYHWGIKGMRWGVRRYQNTDGSLSNKGKKKIAEKYKKLIEKANRDYDKKGSKIEMDAYNKAADYMNKGGIKKFNDAQRKKHGENFTKRKGYVEDYNKAFNKVLTSNMNKSLNKFYSNNKNIKRANELVEKYNMTDWNDLAMKNEKFASQFRKIG